MVNQCQKIQGATTQKLLSRMGYNQCIPSAVTYADMATTKEGAGGGGGGGGAS